MSQRGITLIGFMIVLALAGFAFLIGAKLFPMYTEFMAVKAAMVQVQNTPGSARLRQNGYFLRVAYEVRKPLVYNLDVVGKFEHSVELGRTDVIE